MNGSFHSKNKEGIIPFLRQSSPDLKIVTITVIDQENMDHLEEEHKGLADFIIAIPADMTKTY